MSIEKRRDHWENIYSTKQINEVSWYQATPLTSLHLIDELNLSNSAEIIDVGGGDSFLIDNLLRKGFKNLTVLDISKKALDRAHARLGALADNVNWTQADAGNHAPKKHFDLWHDRAAFHFLTKPEEIRHYIKTAANSIKQGGYLVLGTFSENGPLKCSGIAIKQYTIQEMTALFSTNFEAVKCLNVDHATPFNSTQNFTFCVFKRK